MAILYEIYGETKDIKGWLQDNRAAIGLHERLFRTRIRQGWSNEKALTFQVRDKPNGLGKYLYGYPYDECGYIAWNHFTLPEEPAKYVYWLSEDCTKNIHRRNGKFYLVVSGQIVDSDPSFIALVGRQDDEEMRATLIETIYRLESGNPS